MTRFSQRLPIVWSGTPAHSSTEGAAWTHDELPIDADRQLAVNARGPGKIFAMLGTIRDLVDHKGHANAALLTAVRDNPAASSDPELLELLHHILLANRFWLLAVLGEPFVFEHESARSSSFDDLVLRYARMQAQEAAWLGAAVADDLERTLQSPLIPGGECSVAQAFLQVCMHSQGHRAQAAKLLRRHGGTPPATDFILWLATRPEASG